MTQIESKQNNFILPLAIIISGALIAGAVYFSSINTPTVADNDAPLTGRPQALAVNIADVDVNNEPFIGSPDAPVILAYWGDFQCPFCQRFDLETLPTLVQQYVSIGALKVVFKDFQFLGPDSQAAGLAAKAVWELYPDQYFSWHQAIFEAQDGENSGFGNKEDIIQLIRDKMPDIDADEVSALMRQKATEYQKEQDADKDEGAKFGINSTPGFIIGNQTISGAQPTGVFTQVIDAELRKAQ